MPVAHITLQSGRSRDEIAAIGRSLHGALVSHFAVPEQDCFLLFHELPAHAMLIHRDYLVSQPRSAGWMLIEITAGLPRSAPTKAAFYQAVVAALAASPGIAAQDIMIVLGANQIEDWSFGEGKTALTAGRI